LNSAAGNGTAPAAEGFRCLVESNAATDAASVPLFQGLFDVATIVQKIKTSLLGDVSLVNFIAEVEPDTASSSVSVSSYIVDSRSDIMIVSPVHMPDFRQTL
jgi:hypothetical protein